MRGCSSECDVRRWASLCVGQRPAYAASSLSRQNYPPPQSPLSWTRTSHPRDTTLLEGVPIFCAGRGNGVVVHALNATFEDARRAANHRRGGWVVRWPAWLTMPFLFVVVFFFAAVVVVGRGNDRVRLREAWRVSFLRALEDAAGWQARRCAEMTGGVECCRGFIGERRLLVTLTSAVPALCLTEESGKPFLSIGWQRRGSVNQASFQTLHQKKKKKKTRRGWGAHGQEREATEKLNNHHSSNGASRLLRSLNRTKPCRLIIADKLLVSGVSSVANSSTYIP